MARVAKCYDTFGNELFELVMDALEQSRRLERFSREQADPAVFAALFGDVERPIGDSDDLLPREHLGRFPVERIERETDGAAQMDVLVESDVESR